MDNNLSTDKQLVSSIRNTEWIDLSPGHKTLRTSIEEHINNACVLKNDTSPIMVKGALGLEKQLHCITCSIMPGQNWVFQLLC